MDQLKEYLRQAIKYRFWIVVGISALMPLIAYFVAAGSLQAETDTETKNIEAAKTGVKPFESGPVINKDYAPEVEKRTVVLTKDVNAAWKKLYDRQAPLLTWPPQVSERFAAWGRKWPAGVDNAMIADTINTYTQAQVYSAYVDEVYNSFRPFNYETGEGIVAAPPKDALLRPMTFVEGSPPTLGAVWEAQERLWVQRTVLDVIDKVNAEAKDWDGATIKQLVSLEVANSVAQDQRSVAKGETLETPPEIVDPSAPKDSASASTDASSKDYQKGTPGGPAGGMGMGGGIGGPPKTAAANEPFSVLKPKSPTQQYQVVPVYVAVYIDQSRIPELIVGFQNSPMTVQVLDFEMLRASSRVKKPAKGDANQPMGMMMGGGMMGGGMMGEMVLGMGRGSGTSMGYGGGGMMGGMGGGDYASRSMGGMMGGTRGMMAAGGGPTREIRKGVDVREEVRKREEAKKKKAEGEDEDKDKEKEKEKKKDSSESKINDPYFNIIEVRVYGQARFYNQPPVEEASPSQSASAQNTTPASPEAAKTDSAKPEPAKTDAAKGEEARTTKDEASKDDTPASETSKPDTTKDEAAKDETPAAATPKHEADTSAAAKDEKPKQDAPRAEAAKGDASKADSNAPGAPKPKAGGADVPAPKR